MSSPACSSLFLVPVHVVSSTIISVGKLHTSGWAAGAEVATWAKATRIETAMKVGFMIMAEAGA